MGNDMQELQELVLGMWKPNSTRCRYNDFKPVFERFTGIGKEQEYNDLCATIKNSADQATIISDGNFLFQPQVQMLSQIKKEIAAAPDLDHIGRDLLIMFGDEQLNQVYLNALNYTVGLASRAGFFQTRRQKENFVLNQIVLTVSYLTRLPFAPDHAPKVIFYDHGDLDEKSFWFLMLCYVMGMDVLVLAPCGENALWRYDLDHLSFARSLGSLKRGANFAQRAAAGHPIEKLKTTVSVLSGQIDESLFGSTGVFKPWSFRGKAAKALQIDGTRIDLENGWDREARLREGFQAGKDEVTVPVFYMEIDGMDKNHREYLQFLDRMREAKNTAVDSIQGASLLRPERPQSEAVRLVFAMNPDGSFNYEKLAAMPDTVLDSLSAETGELFVSQMNAFIARQNPNMSKDERVRVANLLLSMSKKIGRMIENQDYPFQVPKVLLFLPRESRVLAKTRTILSFLSFIGFDVLVLAPSGVSGLTDRGRTILRLDEMVYDQDFPPPPLPRAKEKEEEGLLKSVMDFFRS